MANEPFDVSPPGLRRSARLGVFAIVGAQLFDAAWHAWGPGEGRIRDLLLAHAPLYVALAVVTAGAVYAYFNLGMRKATVVAVLVGSLVSLVGHALDIYAHAAGASATVAHAVFLGGEILAVLAGMLIVTEPKAAARERAR